MRVELVRIGNSRGIRIPKAVIEQCKLGDAVDLRVENGHVVIAPERHARQGWREAFAAAGSSKRDRLLLEPLGENRFDTEEWTW